MNTLPLILMAVGLILISGAVGYALGYDKGYDNGFAVHLNEFYFKSLSPIVQSKAEDAP